MGFPGSSAGKESACNDGDLHSIPGLGISPGEGKVYLLQYSGLENSTDCIDHGIEKSQTQLSGSLTTLKKTHRCEDDCYEEEVYTHRFLDTGDPGHQCQATQGGFSMDLSFYSGLFYTTSSVAPHILLFWSRACA